MKKKKRNSVWAEMEFQKIHLNFTPIKVSVFNF